MQYKKRGQSWHILSYDGSGLYSTFLWEKETLDVLGRLVNS
jgi:hypothetical protein